MFSKKTIRDIHLKNKRILLRVAYDITLAKKGSGYVVPDDFRIRATLPTIEYLLKQNCSLVIMSWLGRPDGRIAKQYRMDPVAKALSKLIKKPVKKINDCVGPQVKRAVASLQPGEILMLENTRFYREEQKNDPRFARHLAESGELIVFDAFGQAHRVHASTTGILALKPSVAGLLMEKEVMMLSTLLHKPHHPFIIVLGGAKISDKLEVIQNLSKKADHILIGGGLANTVLKAEGIPTGDSLVEGSYVNQAKGKRKDTGNIAKQILQMARKKKLFKLPIDLIAAKTESEETKTLDIDLDQGESIPDHWEFLDIGPRAAHYYADILRTAKTVFWNGPMGLFEIDKFSKGTEIVARSIAASKGTTVIGGGDTEKIVQMFHLGKKFTHVSTGGGASLEFLAGKKLPALQMLPNKKHV